MPKKKEQSSPTPNLGIPKSNRQIFTYSENKILDQITLEITEAWSKDLVSIRECHKKTKNLFEFTLKAANILEKKVEDLDNFFSESENLSKLNQCLENQNQIFSIINCMRSDFLSIKNKMEYPIIKNICEDFKKINKAYEELNFQIHSIKDLQAKILKKKWWQFWK